MINIIPVVDENGLAQAHSIRRQVFIIGQNVPESVEMDEFDEVAYHVLCRVEGEAVATGRVHIIPEGGKIERVAVLDQHRGKGIGKAIVHHLIEYARDAQSGKIFANVQLEAVPFYEKMGFVGGGEHFYEGGIEHIRMELRD